MAAAMGPVPEKPCPLEPKLMGVLRRPGYQIEKRIFQSRPGVWVTASLYVPDPAPRKAPAVLAVHGHWPWARRDPVVQARCLGLVKLGFVVLAVDAFGAGERYPVPARGTYHGALFGTTLWPVGQTLLGMQVYDNRRAVDYLCSRPEVDPDRLGITGASGGGNQSMYAGALDTRFRAVVPVCSVGSYQAYLHAACCVCEVLPGALRFTEEGDVLALTAPRALLVMNATRDAFQFSVSEATRTLAWTRAVYKLYGGEDRIRHAVFESEHAYNQAMRETMYGWMVRWLKDEGDGKPIPEPAHTVETPEDLSCFTAQTPRPRDFLFPPTFAAREAARLLARFTEHKPDHAEEWESTAVYLRDQLRREVLGGLPKLPRPAAELGKAETAAGIATAAVLLHPEPGLPLAAVLKRPATAKAKQPAAVLLHLDGQAHALRHPLAAALLNKGWAVLGLDLRATGAAQPAKQDVGGAPDHHSAEHAVWIGRPLLGQWVFDVLCALDWLGQQASVDVRRLAVVGLEQAGVVALCAAGLFDDRVTAAAAVDSPATLVTEHAYPAGWRMGLLAPGLLRLGDKPHLAALVAPRRLVLAGGVTAAGKKLIAAQHQTAYAFTRHIYGLYKAESALMRRPSWRAEDIASAL
jgi:dienelactone hydrolase